MIADRPQQAVHGGRDDLQPPSGACFSLNITVSQSYRQKR